MATQKDFRVKNGIIVGDSADISNDLTVNSNTLYVDSASGRVGVGTTSPASALDITGNVSVTGSVDGRDIASDGSKLDGIESGADVTDTANVTSAGAVMDSELTNESAVKNIDQELTTTSSVDFSSVTVSGTVTADDFNTVSDVALKENVETISNALNTLYSLRGVTFTFKESGKDSIGLIAQEVEEVLPQLVATDTDTGRKSVSYSNLVGLLVEAIKEQQSQIDDLKSRVYK